MYWALGPTGQPPNQSWGWLGPTTSQPTWWSAEQPKAPPTYYHLGMKLPGDFLILVIGDSPASIRPRSPSCSLYKYKWGVRIRTHHKGSSSSFPSCLALRLVEFRLKVVVIRSPRLLRSIGMSSSSSSPLQYSIFCNRLML